MKRVPGVPRIVLGGLFGAAGAGAIFFLSAGRWDLPVVWAAIVMLAVLSVAGTVRIDPGLLAERLKPGPGGQDQVLILLAKLLVVGTLIVAGLDVGRFHWSAPVPPALQILGLAGLTLGTGVAVRSMVENPFFSSVVRLQSDRGHHLITSGPYRYVRHPGYAGILITGPCFALALGSWLSLLPMVLFSLLILRRTHLEDRFLREKLEGYSAYAEQVPWRFFPGLW